MPEITRLFIGPGMEFEVEVVFAHKGDTSPREAHDYEEHIVVVEGTIMLECDGCAPVRHEAVSLVSLPVKTEHVISAPDGPARLIVLHPDRTTGDEG